MFSNGISNSSTAPDDMSSGSQSGRYGRSNSRRPRGRGSNERGNSGRPFRRNNYRDTPPRSTMNPSGVIDIHDSSEWPSIQESSSGNLQRSKINHNNEIGSEMNHEVMDRNNSSESRPSSYLRGQSSGSNNVYQTQSNYPNQSSNTSRYYSQRGRGSRYSGGNSRYHSNNYQKRYPNRPVPHMPPLYARDPNMFPGVFNGQLIFPAYPNVNVPDNRPTALVDPVKQVEYYFSAVNLETDNYMRAQMDQQGWVDINIIHQFKRISNLNLSLDVFIEKLLTSDKIEVDVDNKKVRTRFEPEKWYLPEGKPTVPKLPDPAQQHYTQGYDQYNPIGFAPVAPPYGAMPPMFIPFQGAYRGMRTKYVSQYGMYPSVYAAYPPYDSVEPYYYQSDFSEPYAVEGQSQGYYSTTEEQGLETESRYLPESTGEGYEHAGDVVLASTDNAQDKKDEEELSKSIAKMEINK